MRSEQRGDIDSAALFIVVILTFIAGAICGNIYHLPKAKVNRESRTTDPACSVQTTTIGGEVVTRGGLEVNGVVEDGAYYPYADTEALPPEDAIECWITHYGPPDFTNEDTTARLRTIQGCRVELSEWAWRWGIEITGFCAVSPGLPWYRNVRDTVPVLIHVEGHGDYLVMDRKDELDCEGIDLYEPEQASFPGPNHFKYSEIRNVWKIQLSSWRWMKSIEYPHLDDFSDLSMEELSAELVKAEEELFESSMWENNYASAVDAWTTFILDLRNEIHEREADDATNNQD